MAEIMKSALRKACLIQKSVELMGHDCAIQGLAVRASEHQVPFVPALPAFGPLFGLTGSMFAEDLADRMRHHDGTPASHGLRFNELENSIESLQLPGHT